MHTQHNGCQQDLEPVSLKKTNIQKGSDRLDCQRDLAEMISTPHAFLRICRFL
jgi:hypothetical protein